MAGVNLALRENRKLFESSQEKFFSSSEIKPCIFISYQRADEKFAGDIVKYILSHKVFSFDVYFDLNDNKLNYAKKNGISEEINRCIINGLSVSQHMLVVLSNSTMKSFWVPFEIGVGYGQAKEILILNHKNVGTSLPSYIKALETISSKSELDEYLSCKSELSGHYTRFFSSLNENVNPLSEYLNE